ncbi:uncharacterized protein [Primulina eburnea]|uniref:uncharacterized protein n=1 Tax=Primulina eburnea TaxID=1245227 RepID=UPI003C6C433F
MISGGSTDGDSNRARKSRSRRECLEVEGSRKSEAIISFGPEDLRGVNLPHNDALMDLQGYHLETVETALFGFAGHVVYPEGEIILPLTLGSHDLKKTVTTSFTVVDSPSSYNIILGRPVMNELRAVASTYHQKIKFPVGSRVGEVKGDQSSSRKCYVEAVRTDQSRSKREGKKARIGEVGGRIVEEGEIHFVAEEEQEAVEIGPGQQIRVARDLSMTTRVSLIKCLKTNIHVFAWSQQELTEISPFISEHHLNILPGSHPVKQKKRHFGPEKNQVISEQVKELLKAEHIREIQFPTWLSNVVLVPKSSGKWRICVDFRDLNKACPKDHYPLPWIDQLVDSTSGYELLSFMDAYQGYHQISLAKNDQDKASFVTSGGFESHALRGPELRYTEVEKIALALIVTARNLRPYFLSHQIVVLTNSPLGRIMTHSEVSGRMIKWTVELGEYDIEYKPRMAIKAQALSDFLSEMIQPSEEEVWRVFVDGASGLAGCGVGVVMISPPGEKIKLAIRIDSRVTNNEAEYEAVLAGIRAAREVGASRIILYSDSQLITQQIKGVYEAKDNRMLKYLQLIKTLAEGFADCSIEQIPREENNEADILAKMAASLNEVSTREVLHVSRLILSTEEEGTPEPESSWMTPLIRFIEMGALPEDRSQAQKI